MTVLTDFAVYCCPPDMPIREVLARLNTTEYVFQMVLDEGGRLIGTVTDGDIRRAILEGATLEDRADICMHRDPATGRAGAGADDENRATLRTLGLHAFLPLVDGEGRVQAVLIGGPRHHEIKTALVMAGGMGKRLGARTRTTPKPLIEVAGKPILEHVLARLEAGGVFDIHISVHYLADQVRAFVAQRESRAAIHIVAEEAPLGTAGALGQLSLPGAQAVLVVNGDLITGADFAALGDFHERHGYDATVGVARHETEIPYGVIHQDADGLFARIDEKPSVSHFVAAGVYYLSPEFIGLIPRDQPIDMPELLNMGRKIGLKIGLFPIHEYWKDVGRPADLQAANHSFGVENNDE